MLTKETLSELLSNVEIQRPYGHKERRSLEKLIADIDEIIDLLFHVLDAAETVPDLERTKDDFVSHCTTIIDFRIADYSIAIEGLAQKFESFLKIIGHIRYQNTEYWLGNEKSAGIQGSTLEALVTGILNNKREVSREEKPLRLPFPLVDNSKLSSDIFKFLRLELRNAVHDAPRYQKKDLIAYSELAIVAYLLAVRDNYDLLAERFFPVQQVLKQIIENNQHWKYYYVHSQLFEANIVDLIDISPTVIETAWLDQGHAVDAPTQRKGKILDIFKQVNQLVILGDPGLGKTTTLEYLAFHIASEDKKTPLFFSLREYHRENSLYDQILQANGITLTEAARLIKKGKLVFLLDGLNEVINDQDRQALKTGLIIFLRKSEHSHVVITSRQSAYLNDFKLPVFDLQALSDEEIIEFTGRFDNATDGNLAESIDRHPKLKHLCRNPLLLKILLTVSVNRSEVPNNKGLILKQFVEYVLNREQQKNAKVSKDKYFLYLKGLGYKTRQQKKVSFTYTETLKIISDLSATIDPVADRHQIIDTLKDIGILQKHNDFISFSHELYQEYLAAEGILSGIAEVGDLTEMMSDGHWEQPIILYSGLVNNPESFIRQVAAHAPLLAAKCIENSVSQNPELVEYVSNVAYEASLNETDQDLITQGIYTLLKLDKSVLISDSINNSLNRFGKMAYRFLGPVSSRLITDISIEYLVPIIRLITQSSKEFSKTVIRSLERRDKKEVIEHGNEIIEAFSKMGFKDLPLVYIFRLYQLLDINEPLPEQFQLIRRHCMKLACTSNMVSDYKKSAVANILIYYGLINDVQFISQVIKSLGSKDGKNHSFLQFVATHNSEVIPKIIPLCLQAKNLTVQSAGIYYCIKFKLIDTYKTNLEKLEVYRNLYNRALLNKLRDGDSYIQGINKISSHYETTQFLQNCELNSRLFCRVHAHAKEGYYSLLVPKFAGKAKIYPSEISPGIELRLLDKHQFRVSFIDKENQTIQFSMLDSGNVNYEQQSDLLPFGSTARGIVTTITDKYTLLSIADSLTGIIRRANSGKLQMYQIGDEVSVRIQGYDNQRKQYVVQPTRPPATAKIKIKKNRTINNQDLSDLGLRLKASLDAKRASET